MKLTSLNYRRLQFRPHPIRRAFIALALGVLITGILFFVTPLLPYSSHYDAWTYWKLCWSQSFWISVFPSPPGSSAPSGNCYLAMLASDVIVFAIVLFAILSIKIKYKS
jgi:hypothetical protein